jgi:hypothetical protein
MIFFVIPFKPLRKYLTEKEVINMAEQKVPKGFCGCGCDPLKQKEIKECVPTKTKKEKLKKSK